MTVSSLYRAALQQDGARSDPQQELAVARLDDLLVRLTEAPPPTASPSWRNWLRRAPAPRAPARGLYLWGGVGRGKTWLMDLFHEALPGSAKQRLHYHRFMQRTHAELRRLSGRSDPLEQVARALGEEVQVLCLDEFVVTDIGDAMILAGLLRGLFRAGVTLVTTSNVPPEALYRDGIQRASFLPAIDLLQRHTEVLQLGGDHDYRRQILDRAAVYHQGLGADTEQRLRHEFDSLAKEGYERNGELRVLGRDIAFRRRAGGLVWFDFDALCGPPRSQQDYIEVARCHHTVLISDIPRLDGSRDDRTRRFIFLIDEFYDRNVKLIVSAAAPPERLYSGERLAFEFQRTASRLLEMQTPAYLGRVHRG
jgi:cell division protein ZapE